MEYGPGIIKELAIVHPMNYVFELISYGEQYRISTVIQPSSYRNFYKNATQLDPIIKMLRILFDAFSYEKKIY
ncbi:MAG: hypothetical protein U5Q03_04700 [Bacteroidota bacterium]|nr:hypothetical protein [Bacteroidota bacterium]